MASTRKGVWDLQEVRDKYLQSLWANNNTLFVWGTGSGGRLGVGNKVGGGGDQSYSSPIQLPGEWSVVACNSNSSAGVKGDGTLWTWGYGEHGNLGHNQPSDTNVVSPKQVGTNTNWSYVSACVDSTGAINASGEMYTWGLNNQGMLGHNNQTKYSSPVQVPGTTWAEIAFGGGANGIYRKTDGTLWTCGANNDGQLGQNNETAYSSPKQVGTQTNWTQISTGIKQVWGLTNPGALYVWGEQIDGNMGFNNPGGKYSSPKQLPGSWKSISGSKSCAWGIKTDGTLWSWGQNNEGQLGLNGGGSGSSPRQVGSDTNWEVVEGPRGIGVGDDPCVMAVKTDGTLWTWGYADNLGLGHNAPPSKYSSPTQVGASTKWSTNRDEMSCGKWAMFAIEKALTPSQL